MSIWLFTHLIGPGQSLACGFTVSENRVLLHRKQDRAQNVLTRYSNILGLADDRSARLR